MIDLIHGKAFTYVILCLYAVRALSYLHGRHLGPAAYWVCAFGITVSAEFLIARFP